MEDSNKETIVEEGLNAVSKKRKTSHSFHRKKSDNAIKKRIFNRPNFGQSRKPEIDQRKLAKYTRGNPLNSNLIKDNFDKRKLVQKESKYKFALEQSVRSELLLTEESGFLEVSDDEKPGQISQEDIQNAVDPMSASKRFDLVLKDFGPYRMNYTRNGRYLLLGGKKGHVSAIDWISKKLKCEMNVMESVHDICWLHQETMYAVAQKKWTYFYDNQGIEIHCVKALNNVVRCLFLPYHFLLSTVSSAGLISWLDVSIGKIVENIHCPPHHNPSTAALHPGNALICLGRPSGVVSFWSPNHKKASITKYCDCQAICSVSFDPRGEIFATASESRKVKLWDARNLAGPMQQYTLRCPANCISLSAKGFMAVGMGNVVEIYKDYAVDGEMEKKLYLRHKVGSPVRHMEFCPYEDVLGVAHSKGFSSILVPGSAEANFDALEANPFQTKSQRRESEIHQLLNKIPYDLITWDPTDLRKIHVPSLEDIIEEKKKLMFIKAPNIQIEPRYKTGKKSGSANAVKRKKIMKEELRKKYIESAKQAKASVEVEKSQSEGEAKKKKKKTSVLDRFKPKPLN